MEYNVTDTEEVPITDLSQTEDIPPDLDVRDIDGTLGCDELAVKLWYFQEGEEISYHAHAKQEELFYVVDGTFSLKLGRSGEAEYVDVDEGGFWAAASMIGHGHRCVSEDGGTVLAVGAPKSEDPGLDPHELADEEIDEALGG